MRCSDSDIEALQEGSLFSNYSNLSMMLQSTKMCFYAIKL